MAETTLQPDLQIIKLCAGLAKFAYTSGDPASCLSLKQNTNETAKRALLRGLGAPVEDITQFQRYYSHSWFIPKSRQPKWFRSYAYFWHIKGHDGTRTESKDDGSAAGKTEDVNRIIVGFRGTWNDPCGLSDFYYDGTLIRVPYRKGTVWKWYAYWGSLILEGTNWASRFFAWPRAVAKDWMTRPNVYSNETNGGHVHLGFWSLWAAPEGFAGYDRQGHVSSKESVIASIRQALKAAEDRKTDVYVVGHSLGAAVSSFAALDIAKELEQHSNATMYHVTFGSPPVGTPAFARYFDSQLGRHQSWRVSHERDLVAQCFSWCASRWYLRWLNWWTDWSCAGQKVLITRTIHPGSAITIKGGHEIGIFGKGKLVVAGFAGLVALFVSSLLAVPVSAVAYFWRWRYYSDKRVLQTKQGDPGDSYKNGELPHLGPNVGLEYHSLQRYIDLMENEKDLEISLDRERGELVWVIGSTSSADDAP